MERIKAAVGRVDRHSVFSPHASGLSFVTCIQAGITERDKLFAMHSKFKAQPGEKKLFNFQTRVKSRMKTVVNFLPRLKF